MVARAFHPIVLAGALVALPAFAALGRSRETRSTAATVPVAEIRVSSPAPVPGPDGAVMVPIEVVDAGALPVRKLVEIQAVPEPSVLLLLAPSLLLVLRRRR
ncbi:hypothetical protein [Luteolibacter sp. LG18]|uniref:hypothetical protein n=1 Tax=Luteolibacter sp. LG18 TaxID=2819286 RepID=UPI002B28E5F2|nr:hypothetical protein llg_17020 [Luteolibacter sp. LG18]